MTSHVVMARPRLRSVMAARAAPSNAVTLLRYRRARSPPACSLDLGAMQAHGEQEQGHDYRIVGAACVGSIPCVRRHVTARRIERKRVGHSGLVRL